MGRDDVTLNKDMAGSAIAYNVQEVRARIAAAAARSRVSRPVRLVVVTKEASPEQVKQAAAAGVLDFGENRVQDATERLLAVPEARWHFIGHLQRNKVRYVVGSFCMIHSLDSLRLGERISQLAIERSVPVPVLLEVNVSGEASKYGISPDEAEPTLMDLSRLPGLSIRGLMTIAPWGSDPERARPHFAKLHRLRERLASRLPQLDLSELSMGMTDDFEVAVEEGATIVRVGRAIFGERRETPR